MDALREDPDVLMVGEIREPETMRLTLNAAETGHLVLTTVHSATCVEALQRIVSAFAPETKLAAILGLHRAIRGDECDAGQSRRPRRWDALVVRELPFVVGVAPASHSRTGSTRWSRQ